MNEKNSGFDAGAVAGELVKVARELVGGGAEDLVEELRGARKRKTIERMLDELAGKLSRKSPEDAAKFIEDARKRLR